MTKVKDKLNQVTGWLTSNCFAEEELYTLQEKINEAVRRVEEMRQCYEKVDGPYLYPIDNLVGLQYRLNNLEQMKQDLLSTTACPPMLANLQGTQPNQVIYDDVPLGGFGWINIPDEGKKESEMCYKCNPQSSTANATVVAVSADPTKDMRDHLSRRLNQVYGEKTDEVYKYFYTVDEPKTKADMLARLKEGKFSLGDDSFDKEGKLLSYHSALESFSWRLAPVDMKAYEDARQAVRVEHTKANDTIAVMSPEQGLEALRAFEAWQPTDEKETAH